MTDVLFVSADDRDQDNQDEPGRPKDLRALCALWIDRNVQYAQGAKALRPEQIEVIRRFREMEADDLPVEQRAKGWAIAHCWYPPEHGQGQVGK